MRHKTYIFLLIASILTALVASIFIYFDRQSSNALIAAPLKLGTFIITHPLSVQYDDKNDRATAFIKTLNSQTQHPIKKYQHVILYDKDGKVMPLSGKISILRQSASGTDILITLPKDTNTNLLKTTVDIITFQADRISMVPLRAIQYEDDNKTTYVWQASQENSDDKKFNLAKQEIDISKTNTEYAILLNRLNTQIPLLLNPRENMDLEKKYDIQIKELNVPNNNPIYNAWADYVTDRNAEKIKIMALKAESCGDPDVIIDTSSIDTPIIPSKGSITTSSLTDDEQSTTCNGATDSGIISAEQIFSNIGILYKGESQNSCGSNSCGQ